MLRKQIFRLRSCMYRTGLYTQQIILLRWNCVPSLMKTTNGYGSFVSQRKKCTQYTVNGVPQSNIPPPSTHTSFLMTRA